MAVLDILMILALIGFIGVTIWLVMTALAFKNGVVANAKRLYVRPLDACKNIAATGKGIVQQETSRVKQIGATGKEAADRVREEAVGIRDAVMTLKEADVKPLLTNAQSMLKILSLIAGVARSSTRQKPAGG